MAFTNYLPLVVDHTKVPNTNQTDFPVLVLFTDVALKTIANGGHVADGNGYDIRPYADSSASTALSYQLESYNAATGAIRMRVKVPTLTTATDYTIYLMYGDAALNSDGSSTAVWNSGYVAAWPLGDGTTLSAADKTANGYDWTNNGAAAAAGKVDGGADFDGSADNMSNASGPSVSSGLTLEVWLKADDVFFDRVIQLQGGNISVTINLTAFGSRIQSNVTTTGGGNSVIWNPGGELSTGTWYHVAVGFTAGSTLELYVDGASVHTITPSSGDVAAGTASFLASTNTPDSYFDGVLDEIKLSNVNRGDDYITTMYNNESNPGTFITVGAEGTPSAGGGSVPVFMNQYRQRWN